MDNTEYLNTYENNLSTTLYDYLLSLKEVDEIRPDAPDVENLWTLMCSSYMPDGVREVDKYPSVSLGWMLFIGMAVAKMWDADWRHFSAKPNLYAYLRDARGYDFMDEFICEHILKLKKSEAQSLSKLAGDVAVMAYNAFTRERFEPASVTAYHAYVRTLHQLYQLGAAMQLHRMGYRMTKIG